MRAFLRAVNFIGDYNTQACLIDGEKIVGILRTLEDVTQKGLEKQAQAQKILLITCTLVSMLDAQCTV